MCSSAVNSRNKSWKWIWKCSVALIVLSIIGESLFDHFAWLFVADYLTSWLFHRPPPFFPSSGILRCSSSRDVDDTNPMSRKLSLRFLCLSTSGLEPPKVESWISESTHLKGHVCALLKVKCVSNSSLFPKLKWKTTNYWKIDNFSRELMIRLGIFMADEWPSELIGGLCLTSGHWLWIFMRHFDWKVGPYRMHEKPSNGKVFVT